ncbi:CidA/LrgA family protein [Microbulbifer aggregans]|uniref:CidA/LrgA family protein n=1 Tax=Microbulbifer aggregans TaxID=1769779 RepID=UPI001CFC81F3|nr:CidA/LrgA family protein [Microbulbifer aggregans]
MPNIKTAAQWLGGAFILVVFELLGRSLAPILPFPVPGSVLGMLLLLLGLMLYGEVPRGLAVVSEQLLKLLVLIFLPAAVGIYFLRDLSPRDWFALFAAMIVGTLVSLTISGLLLNALLKRSRPPESPHTLSEGKGDE